jgi:hypothetical protein
MDSKDIIARFEAERQALAMMDHPNVAKVQADTERNRADREIGEGDRNHRIEQEEAYMKEAMSIRDRIKANELLSMKLQMQREETEERMKDC